MNDTKPATKTETARIEALLASGNTPADILAEAAKQRAEEQRQRDIETAKANLSTVEYYVNDRVQRLRTARAAEKLASDKLLKLSRAAEDFKAGKIDFTAFEDVRYSL